MTHRNAPKSTESWQEIDKFLSDPRWADPTTLYRYFTADGILLYIGITNQPHARHDAHTGKMWFPLARYYRSEVFPCRRVAEWAEDRVIDAENPEFNTLRKPPEDHPGEAYSWFLKWCKGQPAGADVKWSRLVWPDGWTNRVPLEVCDDPKLPPHVYSELHSAMCRALLTR